MGCGCGKKKNSASFLLSIDGNPQHILEPPHWGPILWKYLHCLAEKLGTANNTVIDTDQANYIEILINNLPNIIPCSECQAHASSYMSANPLPNLKGLYSNALRETVRNWLFTFHNNVRTIKQQPIILNNVEECATLYNNCAISKSDYSSFLQAVGTAVRQNIVRADHWRKWYSHSERMRILSGNFVI
jgi:hypothetical protein